MKQNALMKAKLLLVVCLTLLGQTATWAALLAYEGFNYSAAPNLAGLNGGIGWNGGWVDVAGGGGVTVSACFSFPWTAIPTT